MPALARKSQCTGCTACASICPMQCIQMKENEDGFLYPKVNTTSCSSCGACEQVCSVLHDEMRDRVLTKAYAAFSVDDSLRKNSSSGGIFSELAELVLQVDGIVYGACYNKDCLVEHIGIDKIEFLWKLRGAKYSQSNLHDTFRFIKKQLESGKQVLFSGTPCQVAGLKSYLKRDYDNLICIDFVCHGVPSPMVWKEYVKYRSKIDNNGSLPKSINLRNKDTGWSKYAYSVEFKYSDNNRYVCKNNDDKYMYLFVNDYILRESCSDCHFKGYNRLSDITLGDFWGIWSVDPDMDDNKGTSLVLTHTMKGERLFGAIKEKIKSKPVSFEAATKMNPSLLYSSAHKQNREKVLFEIRNNGFQAVVSSILSGQLKKNSLKSRIWRIFRKL